MTTTATTALASLDGSRIDDGLYTAVTDFARHTPWLNTAMVWWTSYGAVLFIALLVATWWSARRKDAAAMAGAIASFAAAAIACVANSGIRGYFQEPRPCRAVIHDFLLEACPAPSDYAFPSNHTTVAFAAATALLVVNRRLGVPAVIAAVLMAFSRVYAGAHYPHDVAAAALIGTLIAVPVVLTGRRLATPVVARLRGGPLRPLLLAA
ncbi:phosphatase PAP2 family protein [Kitasatospora sp. NPDC098663]|uniref:phosphatase PAP2 family protein n=1 Tax=Kitasatospora sp. NPDC098663 TaxID=3364096 RepID=UPI003822844C